MGDTDKNLAGHEKRNVSHTERLHFHHQESTNSFLPYEQDAFAIDPKKSIRASAYK
tara:strand:+ start:4429 stop:4596 length:168 start_codon:yes stop_codon:yes gene_type:complete